MKQKKVVLVALVAILFTVVSFFVFVYVFERIEDKKSAQEEAGFNYEDAKQTIPPPVTEGLNALPPFEEATVESEQQ